MFEFGERKKQARNSGNFNYSTLLLTAEAKSNKALRDDALQSV